MWTRISHLAIRRACSASAPAQRLGGRALDQPLVAPATGEYTFYFYSDNGARLYVGDMETPIIDWWVNQWDIEQKSAPIHLEEGQAYDFKMDWFEATGGSHVYVRWSNDQGMEKTEIPASAFYLPADFAARLWTT